MEGALAKLVDFPTTGTLKNQWARPPASPPLVGGKGGSFVLCAHRKSAHARRTTSRDPLPRYMIYIHKGRPSVEGGIGKRVRRLQATHTHSATRRLDDDDDDIGRDGGKRKGQDALRYSYTQSTTSS